MDELSIDKLVFNLKTEDYFIQRPHHNFFNKIFHSDLWRKVVPFTEQKENSLLERQRASDWYGRAHQNTWVDGILDYTYNKHNIHSIGHFHMHENRKNKPNKAETFGGDATNLQHIAPAYKYTYAPKGCSREIVKYQRCKENGNGDCIEQKINIVEICPKWALELMREQKKFMMKATVIDNQTYRNAMKVEDYNQNRTLRDLKDKTAHLKVIRRDGYWADDRYNPTIYPAPDHNSNTNLGDEILYNDVLGGNIVESETKLRNEAKAEL